MEDSLDYFEGGMEDSDFADNYPQCKHCFHRVSKARVSVGGLCAECVCFGIGRKVLMDYDNS